MASQAVNAKSFAEYVVSLCTYTDGTALSDDNKNQLYDFLLEDFTTPQTCLNINTALAVLNKLYYLMTGEKKTITVTDGSLQSALSANSAKTLVSTVMGDYLSHFVTPALLYSSTECNAYNCATWTLYMPATESFGSPQLTGTLIGGGGGGSGAIAGDGDKNATYTVTSGAGGIGNNSTITLAGVREALGYGGSRGTSVTFTAAGNPAFATSGNSGGSGLTTAVDLTIPRKTELVILAGQGGAGGGACAASGGGTTGAATFTGNDGQGLGNMGTYCLGGAGVVGAAEWSSEDGVFAGGGGNGGTYVSRYSQETADSEYEGVSSINDTTLIRHSGALSIDGVGGRGGFTNLQETERNATTIGLGGAGGTGIYQTDYYSFAHGGSGGNSGGFIVDTTCSAANVLFAYRT